MNSKNHDILYVDQLQQPPAATIPKQTEAMRVLKIKETKKMLKLTLKKIKKKIKKKLIKKLMILKSLVIKLKYQQNLLTLLKQQML